MKSKYWKINEKELRAERLGSRLAANGFRPGFGGSRGASATDIQGYGGDLCIAAIGLGGLPGIRYGTAQRS